MTTKTFNELHKIIDQIYDEPFTWIELARLSKLSYGTVRNLGIYKTMYPRVQTVMALARAVGLKVVLIKE